MRFVIVVNKENYENIHSANNKYNNHDIRGHYLFGVCAFGDASLLITNRSRFFVYVYNNMYNLIF